MAIVTRSSKLCREHSGKATVDEAEIVTELLMSSSLVSISIKAYHCSGAATLSQPCVTSAQIFHFGPIKANIIKVVSKFLKYWNPFH